MAGMTFKPVNITRIQNLFETGLFALEEQVKNDCNVYVRVDQGTLRDSAHTTVAKDTLTVTWDTPYAKRVYYTGKPSRDHNPNASLQWAEVAAKAKKKIWAGIISKAMNGG